MLQRVVLGLAGLAGAAGVALGAVAAHAAGGAEVATASYFLLIQAAAAIGLSALVRDQLRPRLPLVAAAVMLGGAALFSGDLAMRRLAGAKLLWGTAPLGGSLMIVGWLLAAAAGLFSRART